MTEETKVGVTPAIPTNVVEAEESAEVETPEVEVEVEEEEETKEAAS